MATRGPTKGEGGRPKKEIDWEAAEKLANMHATGEEIASVLKISYDTLERGIKAKYSVGFADWFKSNSGVAKVSLRRMMYKACERGNVAMMIWLSKNWLGMKDNPEEIFEQKPTIIKTKDGVEIKLGFNKNKDKKDDND